MTITPEMLIIASLDLTLYLFVGRKTSSFIRDVLSILSSIVYIISTMSIFAMIMGYFIIENYLSPYYCLFIVLSLFFVSLILIRELNIFVDETREIR
jgi:hypothetical protein